MTAKAALCLAFLECKILNVKNCFETIGLTNIAREVPRMVEKPFGVVISRVKMEGKNRYGQPITWYDYRLNPTLECNRLGIEKMIEYVKVNAPWFREEILHAKTNGIYRWNARD